MAHPHRFRAPGRLTNYEMEIMRETRTHRYVDHQRVRYSYMWESLNDPDHPTSREDWQRKREEHE